MHSVAVNHPRMEIQMDASKYLSCKMLSIYKSFFLFQSKSSTPNLSLNLQRQRQLVKTVDPSIKTFANTPPICGAQKHHRERNNAQRQTCQGDLTEILFYA